MKKVPEKHETYKRMRQEPKLRGFLYETTI